MATKVFANSDREHLGAPGGEPDALQPAPGVVAFTGHMTDAPDRPVPRFPASKVAAVRAAIRTYLQQHRVGFGFGSAARGGDLLFLQELLDLGGTVNVILPFPAEDFEQTSVGHGWNDHLDAVLGHPRARVTVLADRAPPDENGRNQAYASCNAAVRRAARAQADLLDQRPRLLAVWNGRPGDGPGGASDAVAGWRNAGLGEPDVIDLSAL